LDDWFTAANLKSASWARRGQEQTVVAGSFPDSQQGVSLPSDMNSPFELKQQ
jgi:hypothetical protein